MLVGLRKVTQALGFVGKHLTRPIVWLFEVFMSQVNQRHATSLKAMQGNPWPFFLMFAAITLASFTLAPRLGMELIPQMEQREFYVDIQLPRGTPIAETDAFMAKVAERLQADTRVLRSYSVAGSGSLMQVQANQGGDFWGRFNVVVKPTASAAQRDGVIADLRAFLEQQPDVQATIDFPELVSIDLPLVVELSGYELEPLLIAAERISQQLTEHPDFTDVRNGLTRGQPELEIIFDHLRMAHLGLTAPDVARLISTQIGGQVATKYNLHDRQIDIRVRLPDSVRNDPANVQQLIVNPGGSPEIPLSAIATIRQITGPSEITRLGQQRVALISASPSQGNLKQAEQSLINLLQDISLPAGVTANIGGQSELVEQSFNSLLMALALAVFLVYLVMASQFESFGHPFLIMFSVPLAAAGSLIGLWITKTPLSVWWSLSV